MADVSVERDRTNESINDNIISIDIAMIGRVYLKVAYRYICPFLYYYRKSLKYKKRKRIGIVFFSLLLTPAERARAVVAGGDILPETNDFVTICRLPTYNNNIIKPSTKHNNI